MGLQAEKTFLSKSDRTGENAGLKVKLVVVEAVSGELVGDIEVHLDEFSADKKIVASHDTTSSSREPISFRFNPPPRAGGGRFFLRANVVDKVCVKNCNARGDIPVLRTSGGIVPMLHSMWKV